MKWIEDLPDDFTQDFRFTVTGVDDPGKWLTAKLKLGHKNWLDIVRLTKDELIESRLLFQSLNASDLSNDPIVWNYGNSHHIASGVRVRGACFVNNELRRISFGGDSLVSAPELSEYTSLLSLSFKWCKSLTDISNIAKVQTLKFLDLSGCASLEDIGALGGLNHLERLKLNSCRNIRDFSSLGRCSELSHLNLSGIRSTPELNSIGDFDSLRELDLSNSNLSDVLGLNGFKGLVSLKLNGCIALTDLSGLSDQTELSHLDLEGCTYADHALNWQVLAGLRSLNSLFGLGEPTKTQILWNAALTRKDANRLSELLSDMMPLLTSPMSQSSLRSDFILGLEVLSCSDSELGEIHDLQWTKGEWARLLLVTNNRLDPVGNAPRYGVHLESLSIVYDTRLTFFAAQSEMHDATHYGSSGIGIYPALKGYVLSVANGAKWEGCETVIQEAFQCLNDELKADGIELHPSWEEGIVDLLMALRVIGMEHEHDTLFKAVTDQNRQGFHQQLRIQSAEAALDRGQWADALKHMKDLPTTKEAQLMRRVIPLVLDDDVPEAILDWIAKANLRDLDVLQKKEGALEELLHNRRIREQFFWSLACQSSFEGLVAELYKAFSEDPWVQALHDEVYSSTAQNGGDASGLGLGREAGQDVMETLGLEMLWQDEALRAEVGARNLRKLMEARGEEAEQVREQARQAAMDLLHREDLID